MNTNGFSGPQTPQNASGSPLFTSTVTSNPPAQNGRGSPSFYTVGPGAGSWNGNSSLNGGRSASESGNRKPQRSFTVDTVGAVDRPSNPVFETTNNYPGGPGVGPNGFGTTTRRTPSSHSIAAETQAGPSPAKPSSHTYSHSYSAPYTSPYSTPYSSSNTSTQASPSPYTSSNFRGSHSPTGRPMVVTGSPLSIPRMMSNSPVISSTPPFTVVTNSPRPYSPALSITTTTVSPATGPIPPNLTRTKTPTVDQSERSFRGVETTSNSKDAQPDPAQVIILTHSPPAPTPPQVNIPPLTDSLRTSPDTDPTTPRTPSTSLRSLEPTANASRVESSVNGETTMNVSEVGSPGDGGGWRTPLGGTKVANWLGVGSSGLIISTKSHSKPLKTTRLTVRERLQPTIDLARKEQICCARRAMISGGATNLALGLQVVIGVLVTGLSVVTRGKRMRIMTAALGGMGTIVSTYLVRARSASPSGFSPYLIGLHGSSLYGPHNLQYDPEQISHELSKFVRRCEAFVLDYGEECGEEFDEVVGMVREEFEGVLCGRSQGYLRAEYGRGLKVERLDERQVER